jgi:hypothetical protein
MGMQFLGGLLSNPLFSNVIAPLLTQALNLVVPGLGAALAPLLPTLLPMAGQLLSGGGAMLAGGGSAGGLSIDGLGSLLSTVSGAFAAPTGAPAAAPAPRAA